MLYSAFELVVHAGNDLPSVIHLNQGQIIIVVCTNRVPLHIDTNNRSARCNCKHIDVCRKSLVMIFLLDVLVN
jgi:hypothetical protein